MLDDAWDKSQDSAVPLREELRRNEKAVGEFIAAGQIASVSKNSASQSYAFGNGALTLPQIAEAWRDLINLFDSCESVVAVVTDAEIYAEMKARMRPVYVHRQNLSNLRCA